MEKYNGFGDVAWFICGFSWGAFVSTVFGPNIAAAIVGIAFVVLIIVLITIIVVEARRD